MVYQDSLFLIELLRLCFFATISYLTIFDMATQNNKSIKSTTSIPAVPPTSPLIEQLQQCYVTPGMLPVLDTEEYEGSEQQYRFNNWLRQVFEQNDGETLKELLSLGLSPNYKFIFTDPDNQYQYIYSPMIFSVIDKDADLCLGELLNRGVALNHHLYGQNPYLYSGDKAKCLSTFCRHPSLPDKIKYSRDKQKRNILHLFFTRGWSACYVADYALLLNALPAWSKLLRQKDSEQSTPLEEVLEHDLAREEENVSFFLELVKAAKTDADLKYLDKAHKKLTGDIDFSKVIAEQRIILEKETLNKSLGICVPTPCTDFSHPITPSQKSRDAFKI